MEGREGDNRLKQKEGKGEEQKKCGSNQLKEGGGRFSS